jgi:hypothetical protein
MPAGFDLKHSSHSHGCQCSPCHLDSVALYPEGPLDWLGHTVQLTGAVTDAQTVSSDGSSRRCVCAAAGVAASVVAPNPNPSARIRDFKYRN